MFCGAGKNNRDPHQDHAMLLPLLAPTRLFITGVELFVR